MLLGILNYVLLAKGFGDGTGCVPLNGILLESEGVRDKMYPRKSDSQEATHEWLAHFYSTYYIKYYKK